MKPAAEPEVSTVSTTLSGNEPEATHLPQLDRVVVVGTAGSGKTTFARTLAGILGVPHIELDAIHWLPDWTPRERDEFRALVEEAVSQDRWVVDGNYHAIRDTVWPQATTLIWLNYPFPLVFGRTLGRTLQRVVSGEEPFSGCRESFSKAFLSKDSLLWWVISTYSRRRREYHTLSGEGVFPHLSWIELQRPDQAQAFLDLLE